MVLITHPSEPSDQDPIARCRTVGLRSETSTNALRQVSRTLSTLLKPRASSIRGRRPAPPPGHAPLHRAPSRYMAAARSSSRRDPPRHTPDLLLLLPTPCEAPDRLPSSPSIQVWYSHQFK